MDVDDVWNCLCFVGECFLFGYGNVVEIEVCEFFVGEFEIDLCGVVVDDVGVFEFVDLVLDSGFGDVGFCCECVGGCVMCIVY